MYFVEDDTVSMSKVINKSKNIYHVLICVVYSMCLKA